MACQDVQMCAVLEELIRGIFHWVQFIWDQKLTTEDWVFLVVGAKTR